MTTFDEIKNQCMDCIWLTRAGQKEVWRATHPRHGKTVLKLYYVDDARARREIEIAQNLGIHNVPKIYEVQIVSCAGMNTLLVIEQFIEGLTLQQFLQNGGRFDIKDVVSFLQQGFEFVRQLEKHRVVHRDIKPGNLILTPDRVVYFLDFGIARMLDRPPLTLSNATLGPHTAGYSAPEQFNNLQKEIDSRADLFSLGVVAYECLTGTNPFIKTASDTSETIRRQTVIVPPVLHQIVGDNQHLLMGLISTLMGKVPSMRPKNAGQAIDWLNAIMPTLNL